MSSSRGPSVYPLFSYGQFLTRPRCTNFPAHTQHVTTGFLKLPLMKSSRSYRTLGLIVASTLRKGWLVHRFPSPHCVDRSIIKTKIKRTFITQTHQVKGPITDHPAWRWKREKIFVKKIKSWRTLNFQLTKTSRVDRG